MEYKPMKKGTAKKNPATSTGFFSAKLSSELHSILAEEFDQNLEDGAKLQEIGLRLVEFVAIKERRKITDKTPTNDS